MTISRADLRRPNENPEFMHALTFICGGLHVRSHQQ